MWKSAGFSESSAWVRDLYRRSWAHAIDTFAVTQLDDRGTVPWFSIGTKASPNVQGMTSTGEIDSSQMKFEALIDVGETEFAPRRFDLIDDYLVIELGGPSPGAADASAGSRLQAKR